MKLRNVTIWTTGMMLIVTLAVPTTLAFFVNWKEVFSRSDGGSFVMIALLFCSNCLPPAISFAIARKLKHDIPALVLLVSTICYALWYGYYLYQMVFVNFWAFIGVCLTGIALLFPVLLPLWILALLLNLRYAKKVLPTDEKIIE